MTYDFENYSDTSIYRYLDIGFSGLLIRIFTSYQIYYRFNINKIYLLLTRSVRSC